MKSSLLAALSAGALALGLSQAATAAEAAFPQKSVTIVIPSTPGGTADILGRFVGQRLSALWGQSVVVENRPGGLGIVGAEALVRSRPDGYTIGLLPSNHAILPLVRPGLSYDVKKDLMAVAPVASGPGLLVVNEAMAQARTAGEAFELAKAHPNKYNYAIPVSLTNGHRTMELLKRASGAQIQDIPYKGGAQAVTDLIGGQVQFLVIAVPSVIAHVESGKLRALAVTTAQRFEGLPQIPTLAESGFPGFDSAEWYGLFAPAGVPAAVVEKIAADVRKVLDTAEVRERFLALGVTASLGGPAELGGMFDREYGTWQKLLKDVSLRAD